MWGMIMNKINVSELFPLQEKLDEEIHRLHNVNYVNTLHKRIVALLVELGEFANETRAFKFWSLKGPSEKSVILDEYADALHFFLSIGIAIGVKDMEVDIDPIKNDLVEQILLVYQDVSELSKIVNEANYRTAFKDFLNIAPILNYSSIDIINAYKQKLAVNYKRQENHY